LYNVLQMLPDLRNSYILEHPAQVSLCMSELSIHMVNYICIYKTIQLKYKLQYTGTPPAALLPRSILLPPWSHFILTS